MANFGNFRVVGTPYFMGPILPPAALKIQIAKSKNLTLNFPPLET
jgi:hypothetical protein